MEGLSLKYGFEIFLYYNFIKGALKQSIQTENSLHQVYPVKQVFESLQRSQVSFREFLFTKEGMQTEAAI